MLNSETGHPIGGVGQSEYSSTDKKLEYTFDCRLDEVIVDRIESHEAAVESVLDGFARTTADLQSILSSGLKGSHAQRSRLPLAFMEH